MMIILGYIASVFMGLSLGLIGGGGSILTVPILVYLFKIDPMSATGYSLFIVGITALFGSLSYIKKGLIDFKTGLTFAAPSFLGVYISRAFIVPNIPLEIYQFGNFLLTKPILIMVVFAILMVAASFTMILGGSGKTSSTIPSSSNAHSNVQSTPEIHLKNETHSKNYFLISIEGLIVGAITGFVGAGGGFLIIPALVVLAKLPMRIAVGTSLLIISIKSLFGFIGDLQQKTEINWSLLLAISAIAVVSIFIGSYLSKYIPEAKLKKAFGFFVLIMGSVILFQQLSS